MSSRRIGQARDLMLQFAERTGVSGHADFRDPAHHRLGFRELGLAIGLAAVAFAAGTLSDA